MRQVTVFVNDYPSKVRIGLIFSESDFENADRIWDSEDIRLSALQSIPAFSGYTRWSQCRTEHFRILIMQAMTVTDGLTNAERQDSFHPAMTLFNFLVLGMVKCIEVSTLSTVEIMHVNRLSKLDLMFDFGAVMNMDFAQPDPLVKKNPFKIVVDNTKDES